MTSRRLPTLALLVLTLAGAFVLAGCPDNAKGTGAAPSATASPTPAAVKSAAPAASAQGNGW